MTPAAPARRLIWFVPGLSHSARIPRYSWGGRAMDEVSADSAETQRLLEQARAGDPGAFEQLFAQYRPYLRRVIALRLDARLRPRVDPSDVVQETELEVFQRLGDFL